MWRRLAAVSAQLSRQAATAAARGAEGTRGGLPAAVASGARSEHFWWGVPLAAALPSAYAAAQQPAPASEPDWGALGTVPLANEETGKWRVYTDIGRDLALQGRLEEAARFLRAAITAAQLGFGERDEHVGSALVNLAEVYRLQERYEAAEPLYVSGLDILKADIGANDVRYAKACEHAGWFYMQAGDYAKAEARFRENMRAVTLNLKNDHPEYAASLARVAEACRRRGSLRAAVDLLQRALKSMAEGGLSSSPRAVQRTARLAEMMVEAKRPREAEPLVTRIIATLKSSEGTRHVNVAATADNLALALAKHGCHGNARRLLDATREAREARLPPKHPLLAMTLRRAAEVALLSGDAGQAYADASTAVAIFRSSWERNVAAATRTAWDQFKSMVGVGRPDNPVPMTAAVEYTEALLAMATAADGQKPPKSEEAEAAMREALSVLRHPVLRPSDRGGDAADLASRGTAAADVATPGSLAGKGGPLPTGVDASMAASSPLVADPDALFDANKRHSEVTAAAKALAAENVRRTQLKKCLTRLADRLDGEGRTEEAGVLRRECDGVRSVPGAGPPPKV